MPLSTSPQPCEVADEILRLFAVHGHMDYGERISLQEHMIQSAVFAREDRAPEAVVLASLLHDIGHFLHGLGEDIADQGLDGKHEDVGAVFLQRYFPDAIVEPTRLHVMAKRYLCATEDAYRDALTPASIQSLELQGGPLTDDQARQFESHPHFSASIQVRRYDEAGKVPGMAIPAPDSFRELMEAWVVRAPST